MVQITQALATQIQPTHGFEMPVIYLPEEAMQMGSKRVLPENGLIGLAEMLQRRLAIKV